MMLIVNIVNAQTVVDVIVNSEEHEILEAAVTSAELVETLSGDGPFTVFAPTDAAFQALPDGLIDDLLTDPEGSLTDVLLYHVLGATVLSNNLSDGQTATTLSGADITVAINDDGVFINDNVKVTTADIETDNGVVHVIDAVLMPPTPSNTIFDIVSNSEDHNTLETVLLETDGDEAFNDLDYTFTLFAPTDAAFEALPEGLLDALLADSGYYDLLQLLTYHVLEGGVLSSTLSDGQIISSFYDEELVVTINDDGVFINEAKVMLIPPSFSKPYIFDIVADSEDHTILETALIAAGGEYGLSSSGYGPFTLFAPTDAAFDALPEGVVEALLADPKAGGLTELLSYHLLDGTFLSSDLSDGQIILSYDTEEELTVTINDDGVFINNAKVTVADIEARNGVVHVIDAVLQPPVKPATVVDVIVSSEDHNTLETAVGAAGLVETLSGEGPFTVFAPTDAAFEALNDGVLETLFLTYHVLGSTVLSSDLSDGQTATTLQGADITVTINDDGVFINDAQVTVADIETDNGVVHVINAVLIPPAKPASVVEVIVNSEDHTTLETAVGAAGLVETLSGEGPFTVFAPTDAAFEALDEGVLF